MCIKKKKKLEARKQKTCTKEEMKLAPIECLDQMNSNCKQNRQGMRRRNASKNWK